MALNFTFSVWIALQCHTGQKIPPRRTLSAGSYERWERSGSKVNDYVMWVMGRYPRDPEEDTELLLGWSESGGVWVPKVNESAAMAKGVGRIGNAFTMEERCSVIEKLGGKFYSDPKDCEDTKDMV
jgi:hypothetical protein